MKNLTIGVRRNSLGEDATKVRLLNYIKARHVPAPLAKQE